MSTRTTPTVVSRLHPSPRMAVVLFAIALIPLIYAGLLIWSNEDPTHNLDSVPAAIVNEDAGAEKPAAPGSDDAAASSSTDSDATVSLGDDLTDELLSNDENTNFDWSTMSASAAEKKLASGDVLVVLTIPKDFSAAAVSAGNDDPLSAQSATLSIETNDGANVIIGSVAKSVGTAVTESVASQVSAEYLDNVYLGFSTIHDQIADAADGADEVADGATKAEDGAGDLVVGLGDLESGAVDLSSGASTLAAGAHAADDGAQQIDGGLTELQGRLAGVPDSAATLDAGAEKVASGAHDVSTGAATLATGSSALASGASDLATGASSLSDGTDSALAGAQSLQGGAHQLAAGTGPLATGAGDVSDGLDALLANYANLTDAQRLAAITRLAAGAEQVSQGAASVDDGAQQVSSGADALVGSTDDGTGLSTLSAGATTVAAGATTLSDKTSELATGAGTLAAGAASLDDGAAQVATGVDSVSAKLGELVSAVDRLASGADSLADGTTRVADGADALANGGSALSDGATTAKDGAQSLDDGLVTLSDGSTELSDGLSSGVDDIPSYSDADAEHLSDVASTPVGLDATRSNEVPAYGYGLAPYFMSLALWVGALAFYLMMKPLSERLVATRRPAWLVALGSYVPGAVMALVQSAVMVTVVHLALGIEPADLGRLYLIAALASLTFVAINQALVSLLGAPGRFLGLMLVVLQLSSAGGTYPIQTASPFFQTIHGWFPLTYAVEAFRSLIAGGSIGVTPGIGVMAAWLAGALLVTTLAVVMARRSADVDPAIAARPALA
ncbi:putative membrane protein [Labedella gwakjiensis]|uniref:Putative membrane protein n=1 Tax=Labedella gwakjiensis TaxID=390269 RepID=A0A2P8GZ44_9MICO|nr:YhgE/Pip domain-containing protein [Labedella gwakjiensis]PSL39227.1 putative membrane protein [Labedella gwakjiensis]RUQ86347.1 YhgE/Pip domain-containing protein [Labedella gwakjiensis]